MADTVKVTKRTKEYSETKTIRVERSRSPHFQSIYTNNVQISVSYFDLAIQLGQASGMTDDDLLQVEDSAVVHMSPEHADSFYRLLGQQLDNYRAAFGEIRPHPEGMSHSS